MKSRRRLVQNVDSPPGTSLAQFCASLMRCASPPDNVVDGCPRWIYDNPTSYKCLHLASEYVGTYFGKSSAPLLLSYLARRKYSFPYILPSNEKPPGCTSFHRKLHTAHRRPGRKCISIFNIPSPLHASHRPPFTLKLKRPFLYPFAFASGVAANRSRIRSNTPVYVAGLDRGVRPIGDWSILITLSRCSTPSISLCFPGIQSCARFNAFGSDSYTKSR